MMFGVVEDVERNVSRRENRHRAREKIEWVEALKMKMRERSWAWTTFYTTAEQQQPVVCKEVAEKKMMMMKRQHKVYSELDDERVRRQPSRISHLQRLLEASTNLTRHLDIFWYLFFLFFRSFSTHILSAPVHVRFSLSIQLLVLSESREKESQRSLKFITPTQQSERERQEHDFGGTIAACQRGHEKFLIDYFQPQWKKSKSWLIDIGYWEHI